VKKFLGKKQKKKTRGRIIYRRIKDGGRVEKSGCKKRLQSHSEDWKGKRPGSFDCRTIKSIRKIGTNSYMFLNRGKREDEK